MPSAMTPANDGLPADPILDRYMAMTPDEHRSAIVSLHADISSRLLELGKAIYGWHMRGFSIDELNLNGMTYWLFRVGTGQLYAPLLAKTMYSKTLTDRLGKLPFADQKYIGDGGKLDMVVVTENGQTIIKADPLVMTEKDNKDQLDQLFATHHHRSTVEQRLWIEASKAKAAMPIPTAIGPFAPDEETSTCKFTGRHGDIVSLKDLKGAVRALEKKRK